MLACLALLCHMTVQHRNTRGERRSKLYILHAVTLKSSGTYTDVVSLTSGGRYSGFSHSISSRFRDWDIQTHDDKTVDVCILCIFPHIVISSRWFSFVFLKRSKCGKICFCLLVSVSTVYCANARKESWYLTCAFKGHILVKNYSKIPHSVTTVQGNIIHSNFFFYLTFI